MKKLSTNKLLSIVDRPCGVEFMQQYVAGARKLVKAAHLKSYGFDADTEVNQLIKALSIDEAKEIKENGPIPCAVWLKILDVFPAQVSKQLLMGYCHQMCYIDEEVCMKAMEILPKKDAFDIILAAHFITARMLGQILRISSTKEAKKLVISVANHEFGVVDHECQLKITRVFSDKDFYDILKAFIKSDVIFDFEIKEKMFELLPLNKVKELLYLMIRNNLYLEDLLLLKIAASFSKRQAKAIIQAYFSSEPVINNYTEEEIKILNDQIEQEFV